MTWPSNVPSPRTRTTEPPTRQSPTIGEMTGIVKPAVPWPLAGADQSASAPAIAGNAVMTQRFTGRA